MPVVNGRFYMNPIFGAALVQGGGSALLCKRRIGREQRGAAGDLGVLLGANTQIPRFGTR